MSRITPTVRGFLIIVAVAAIVTALQLQLALAVVLTVIRVLFLAAIAFFLYTLWRNNRSDIALWQRRSQVVFYGAAALAIVDVVAAFSPLWPGSALESLVFFCVLAACGYVMWRVWRDEHTYSY